MRRLSLAALALLLTAGCDTNGIDGPCLVGNQPAFDDNDVRVRLRSPSVGDTLRLGEPFRLDARVEITGPDITRLSARLDVRRRDADDTAFDTETLVSIPLDVARGVTEIDRPVTLGRLRGGVTSADLGPGDVLSVALVGDIRFPVVAEGPGCTTALSGQIVGNSAPVTILNARPTR